MIKLFVTLFFLKFQVISVDTFYYYTGNPNWGQPVPGYLKTFVQLSLNDTGVEVSFDCFTWQGEVVSKSNTRDMQELEEVFNFLIFPNNQSKLKAYIFSVNPFNTQADKLLDRQTGKETFEWDGNWESSVERTDYGWKGRIKIPYNVLNDWGEKAGFAFMRVTQDSMGKWVVIVGGTDPYDPSFSKIIEVDLKETPMAISEDHFNGLFIPYVMVRRIENTSFQGGFDFKLKSKKITLNMVFNPDYAEVESDKFQFDLLQRGIFLPEKRPFFRDVTTYTNIEIPYGKLFYSRSFEKIDFGINGRIDYKNANFFFLSVHNDSEYYNMLRLFYSRNTYSLFSSASITKTITNVGDNFWDGIISGYYYYNNKGGVIGAGLEFSFKDREIQNSRVFTSEFVFQTSPQGFYAELSYTSMGEMNLNKGIQYYRDVNYQKVTMGQNFVIEGKFLNSLNPKFTYRNMESIDGGKKFFRDFIPSISAQILTNLDFSMSWMRGEQLGKENNYLNWQFSLNVKNYLQPSVSYTYGTIAGHKRETAGLGLYCTFKEYFQGSLYHYVYKIGQGFDPLIFVRPFDENVYFSFDLSLSLKFLRNNFLRLFLERETFSNTNALNLMYEREIKDVNSVFYFVVNNRYPAQSKYFTMPDLNNINFSLKFGYSIKM